MTPQVDGVQKHGTWTEEPTMKVGTTDIVQYVPEKLSTVASLLGHFVSNVTTALFSVARA